MAGSVFVDPLLDAKGRGRDGYGQFQVNPHREYDNLEGIEDQIDDPEVAFFEPEILAHHDFDVGDIHSSISHKRANLSDDNMYKRSRQMKAPVATSSSVNFEAANRRIQLTGREYVTTLYSGTIPAVAYTSPYTSTSALLRPTDFTLFSWMAGIAQKFEEYKFHHIQFVYEPQCPTTTSGSVAMWFDEDPTHTYPPNWNSMINTGANVHGAPWAKHVFVVPPHMFAGRKNYYTHCEFNDLAQQPFGTVSYAAPVDPLEYYCGLYGFASQDCGTGVVQGTTPGVLPLGKIYLDYSLTLHTQNTDNWTQTSMLTHSQLSSAIADNSGTGMFYQMPSTATAVALQGNGAGADFRANLLGGWKAGVTTGALPVGFSQAGCQYFNQTYNPNAYPASWYTAPTKLSGANIWTAKMNLEIVLDIGVTLNAASAALGDVVLGAGNFTIYYVPISGQVMTGGILYAGVGMIEIGSLATQMSTVNSLNQITGGAGNAALNTAGIAALSSVVTPLYQLGFGGLTSLTLIATSSFTQSFAMKLFPGDQVWFTANDNVANSVTQCTIGITPLTFGIAG